MSQFREQPSQPPLQAQSMYPHHPLLAGTPHGWTSNPPPPAIPRFSQTTGFDGIIPPSFSNPFEVTQQPMNIPMYENPMYDVGPSTFTVPIDAPSMQISGSDNSLSSSSMGRAASGTSGMGYEYGLKKRACDQCNQSKVRCDFVEPCRRSRLTLSA
jgi:hypothetical protein